MEVVIPSQTRPGEGIGTRVLHYSHGQMPPQGKPGLGHAVLVPETARQPTITSKLKVQLKFPNLNFLIKKSNQ